jgi:low affinity Fe/Cu permease
MPSLGPMDWLRHHFTQLGALAANPIAFFIVCAYGLLWFLFERETFNWHAIATLATWMMTLFIQRSEHRDTQAIHAKLDELLRSDPRAETNLAQLDDEEPEDIEALRRQRAEGAKTQ